MKKKFSLLTLLVVLLMAFSVTACSKAAKPNFGDYEYQGQTPYEIMTIDEGISIDGELTEDIWANCQNTLTSTSNVTPYYDADTQTFKWMDVHTYFGTNGIYVAFEVYDNGIYFNKDRRQTRNTGVELYFTTIENSQLNSKTMSLRVAPNGDTLNPLVSFWRGNGNEYSEAKSLGDYVAAAKINGTLNQRGPNGEEDDEGYVVELAISYDLFGGPIDIYHYTAAFIQMANSNDDIRYANSFMYGIGHLNVGSWKAVTNDGVVTDKYSQIDKTVVWDEGVEMDGKLTEDFWVDAIENDKGKDWTYTAKNITLNMYTHLTDLGVYIGLDSNDKDVWHNPDRVAKYNTGAEVFIVPKGQTTIGTDAKQVRFNVGGGGERWIGRNASNPWANGYFKAKTAGSVKGEGATINSSNTEGWQGEIFVPWSELGVTDNKDKTQIAIQANVYHSTSDEYWENVNANAQANAAGWIYLAPYSSFAAQYNPQETFFLFTKDGFSFNSITARDASLDVENHMSGADILANNANIEGIEDGKDYYYVETVAKVNDGGVLAGRGYTSSKSSNPDGTFVAVDESAVAYEHVGNGNFRLYFEKNTDTLAGFATDKEIVYTNNGGGSKSFKVSYDANMSVNGTLNSADAIVLPIMAEMNTKAIIVDNSFCGTDVFNGFSAVTNEKGVYGLSAIIKDSSTGAIAPMEAIYYIAVGDVAEGVLKVTVDLATGEKDVMFYDGMYWEPAPQYNDFVQIAVGNTLPAGLADGEEGYVVEFKVKWDALDLDGNAHDFINISPAIRMSVDDVVLGQNYEINEEEISIADFVRFGDDGFAPSAMYAQKSVLFVHDEAVTAGTSYSQTIDFSYLGHGGLMSDTTATVEMAKEEVEAIAVPKTVTMKVNGVDAEVTVDYVKPDASAFTASALQAYINFDHGAENLVGNAYTNYLADNKSGVAFVDDGDYAGDKYFNANMKQRSVKVPMTFGSESFTVSMMVDGDALRNHASSTYAFVLFGTGNVDTRNQGFTIRARGDSFQIATNNGTFFNLAFDMSKLDGWQRLTFTIQRVSGGASIYVFVGHELALETNVTMAGDVDVEGYGTLGIGGPGSFRDTETGYKDINIGIDDVIILKKYDILNKQALYNMLAYLENFNEDANFGISAGQFDYNFSDFANVGDLATNTVTITNNLAGAVQLGGAWASIATLSGNTVRYEINKEQAIALAEGESWYKVGDFKKYVNFTFADLSEIVLDKTDISVWKSAKDGDNYILNVTATSEGTGIVDGMGLTFKQGETTLDATHVGDGEWAIEVPATLIEALTEGTTLPITASIAGRADVATQTFAVEYKYLTVTQVASLAQNAEVLLDFEGNSLTNKMTGTNATMIHGSVAFDDGAYISNVGAKAYNNANARNLVVPGVKLGTDSFTISALINLSDLANNAKQISDQGHATILFGTRDVDGTGNDSGFSVMVKANGDVQFRYGETKPGSNVGAWSSYGTGYARFTFVFDRETAGSVTFKMYINNLMVLTGTYSTNISFDYALNPNNQLGIGGGGIREITSPNGSRGTADIRFGDFMLFRGVMSQADIANMVYGIESYYEDVATAGGWDVNDVNVTYEDVVDGSATVKQLALTQVGATHAITDATITGLPEGVTVDNTGKLNIPFAKLDAFKAGVKATATIGGVTRDFTVTYFPLEAIYTDITEKAMWADEKTGDNFVFTVKTFVDEAKTMSLGSAKLPLTFKIGATPLTASETANAGEYTVTVPATLVEGQGAQTITVSAGKTGVADATVAFTHKMLDSATISKLVAGTQSYLSFEDSLKDIAHESRVGIMALGSGVTYETGVNGKAVKINPKNTSVKLDGVVLGANSFTMSFDANISTTNFSSINGNFNEFVSSRNSNTAISGGSLDMGPDNFEITYRGDSRRLRHAVGRNGDYGDGTTTNYMGNYNKTNAGQWHRYTMVITRDIENVAGRTKTLNRYGSDGMHDSTLSNDQNGGAFDASETASMTFYVDGQQIWYREFYLSTDQYIGQDALWLGGQFALLGKAGNIKDNYFLMDNFVVYSGAMTADEVRGMTSVNSSYYAQIGETYGVDVADVNIDFSQKASVLANGYNLEFYNFGKTDITGATLVNPPAGVTLEASGNTYTLRFADETALTQFKTVQTLTMKWGEVARTFTVAYADLEQIYIDTTSVSKWADEKVGGNYTFEVGVYANEAKTVAITDDMGVTVKATADGVDGMTFIYNETSKKYTVVLPSAQVENMPAKTITVAIDGNADVTTASFTFAHNYFDQAKLNEMVGKTESYLNFNDNIVNMASAKATSMANGTATFVDGVDGKAIVLNPTNKSLKITGQEIGSTDFTFSFDVYVTEVGTYLNNYYEFISSRNFNSNESGGSFDLHHSTFQLSYRGANSNNQLRFAAGRNNGQEAQYSGGGALASKSWNRVTVVVDRNTATTDTVCNVQPHAGAYQADGTWTSDASLKADYATPEEAKWYFYINGRLFTTKTTHYTTNQSLGFGDLYLGGDQQVNRTPDPCNNVDFLMDNFVFYRGAMTADEVRGMTSVNSGYYNALEKNGGVTVANLVVDSGQVNGATSYTANLAVTAHGGKDITGATLVGENAGFTLNETAGAYTLTMTADALASAQSGKALTLAFGDVQRTFTVTYVDVQNLYVSALDLYAFENNSGFVTREVKVTADEAGTKGVDNVTFGEGVEVLKSSTNGSGVYVVKVPYSAASYDVNHSALSTPAELVVTLATATTIVKDTDAPAMYSTQTNKQGKQGGKVYTVGSNAFGTDSFSLSVMVKDLSTGYIQESGGSYAIFSNSHTDAFEGFVLYMNRNDGFRFRAGDGTTVSGSANNKPDWRGYQGWHHLLVTFDRSVAGQLTYTVYFDGVKLNNKSATWTFPNGANPSFDTAGTQSKVVFGGSNSAYSGAGNSFCPVNNFNIGIAGTVITKGILDVEAATQYVKYNVQPAIDAFEGRA